jgi:di/tricarboxylate transporter
MRIRYRIYETKYLVRELFDPDIGMFSVLLLLIIGRVITLKDAFAGFSNSGMLTVGFLFIVARALQETGVLLIIASSFGIARALDNSGVTYFLADKLIISVGSLGPLGY